MIDEDGFDWGEGDHGKYERERIAMAKEAERQSALSFEKHLKNLLKKTPKETSTLTGYTLKELYETFEYPKATHSYWFRHGKTGSYALKEPHILAEKLGLIAIDISVRPYSYTVLEKEKSPFALRPYQKHIIDDVAALKGSVLIEAPTGSGKSVIASYIASDEVAKGGKVLIVAPKIILLEQLQETFAILNPQIIHGAKDYDRQHSVFISTIQTAHKRDLGFEPTMIIIDEVHYGFSGKMIEVLLEDFKGRLIGLSATPYDQDGNPLKGFDKHINQYDLAYMLQNNYLVFPKCYTPLKVDLSHINVIAGDYNQTELDSSFNTIEHVMQIVQTTAPKLLEQKAGLVFCINIAHAEAMAKAYSENGIPTKAIHSKLTKSEQDSIMQEYKNGELKMLANPVILTTGFDHPKTDCIVLARATQSKNLYRQMVGRALRLYEGKTHAVILDCAGVINDLGLPTEPIKPSEYVVARTIPQCPECESTKLFRKIQQDKEYIICADCGESRVIEKKGIECSWCGLMHNALSKYEAQGNSLYLICDTCGEKTFVSESSSQEELTEIFDTKYMKQMQKKLTLEYIEYLIDNATISFPFCEEVNKHILALQAYIIKNPTECVAKSIASMRRSNVAFKHSREEDKTTIENAWNEPWSWKGSGRLFSLRLEEELLYSEVADLREILKNTQTINETITIINKLLDITKQESLNNAIHQELLQDIKKSTVPNIEVMCIKRLKDLYHNGESINGIKYFVAMMESVLK